MFKSISQVWDAINQGKTVYWASDAYQLVREPAPPQLTKYSEYSLNNGKCLRVTCMDNWFGSWLSEKELGSLYVKG